MTKKQTPPSIRAILAKTKQESVADHLIVADRVSKTWKDKETGEVRGLRDVSFTVQPGEFCFVVGPTGHGKTTLLRLLRRELKPDSGKISLGGIEINKINKSAYLRKIGNVAQTLDILPRSTVEENIAYPLTALHWDRKDIKNRVDELLEIFSLTHARRRLCDELKLSGGERQRMAIARAIVHGPDLLLCDEPTGHLDPQTTYGVLRTLNRVSMIGTTCIVVTHDPNIVDLMQKRVMLVQHGTVAEDTLGGYRL